MKHKKPHTSAFEDFYLKPLEDALRHAAAEHGVGTVKYLQAASEAHIHAGLRLEAELLERVGN